MICSTRQMVHACGFAWRIPWIFQIDEAIKFSSFVYFDSLGFRCTCVCRVIGGQAGRVYSKIFRNEGSDNGGSNTGCGGVRHSGPYYDYQPDP